jgi:GcrA cell cycle regulator
MSNQTDSAEVWPAERVCHLELLVQCGDFSFAQIGQALDMTKNAVIGKANRLGITGPRSVGPRGSEALTFDERMDALDVFPPRGACVYPFGDVGRPDFHFCGEPVKEDKPYCALHYRVIYHPAPPARVR